MKMIYDEIYRDLLEKIKQGTYPYQSFIPSEAVLTREYNCSHNTLRKAVALLNQQGALQPVHGKGVRVIYQKRSRALFELGGIETFQEAACRNSLDYTTKVLKFERIIADEKIAKQTGFARGEQLYYIVRTRVINDEALILDYNYFLADTVKNLTLGVAQSSIYNYIEKDLHIQIATSKRIVTVEPVTTEDRQLLNLNEVDFLAVVTGQTFDNYGKMFEFTQSRHRPDYFSFFTVARREV